jgi:predicted dithiol-disulfide oxidoreductase (DUF899 family)
MSDGESRGRAPRIVSKEEWRVARIALLTKEKELTVMKDRLSAERRALPWVRVEKDYVFDGPAGVGCSLEVDHLAGIRVHLEHHDLTYAVVARAPIEEIEQLRRRMGWDFTWVSSYRNEFNFDFNVSFSDDEIARGRGYYNYGEVDVHPGMIDLSGDSVFIKDDSGQVYHTYSTFSRGGEQFLGIYAYLDATPKGRAENGPYHSLPDWARPHNMYGRGGMVEGTGRYHASDCEHCAALNKRLPEELS